MNRSELVFECILSGQMNDGQISAELSDPIFAAYHRQRTGEMSMASTKKPKPKPAKPVLKPTYSPRGGGNGTGNPPTPKK